MDTVTGFRDHANFSMHKDVASQTMLCHMNFLLSQLVPQWYFEGRMWYTENRCSRNDRCGKTSVGWSHSVIAGSMNDGVISPNIQPRGIGQYSVDHVEVKSDQDYLVLLNMVAGYANDTSPDTEYIINSSMSYPGYFQLLDKVNFMQPVDVNLLFEILTKHLFKASGSSGYIPSYRSGPSVVHMHRNPKELNMDEVPTGVCSSWPLETQGWRNRSSKTGWPSGNLKEDICSRKCHFVFKAHSSSRDPSSECRFSFIAAESILMSTLVSEQKRCFVIFKMLVKYILSPDAVINSYCLKTTLFWTLETVPSEIWQDPIHGMAIGFLQLLDNLIHFLIGDCIPQYFIPENNLIECIRKSELKSVLRKLVKLRKNPVETLLEHDHKYNLTGEMLSQGELSDLFHEIVILSKINKYEQTIEECLNLYSRETTKYFVYTVQTPICTRAALGALRSLQVYDDLAQRPKRGMVTFVYNHLIKSSKILEMRLFAVICSILFIKGYDSVDSKTKSQQQQTVQKAFERLLSGIHEIPAIEVVSWYAVFLVHCKEYQRAISWLKWGLSRICAMALTSEKLAAFCIIWHMRFIDLNDMSDMLDDVLLLLIYEDPYGNISAPSLAYYLLIDMYVQLNNKKAAEEMAADFKSFCHKSSPANRVQYERGLSDYKLLAFSFMKIGDYSNAERAFRDYGWIIMDNEHDNKVIQRDVAAVSNQRADVCRMMAIYNMYLSRTKYK